LTINNAEKYPIEETKHALIKETDQIMEEANHDVDWRRAYMMYQMELLDERKEGRKEDKLEGKLEGKLEDALAMIKEKLSLDLIARCTGLPLSEIEALGVSQ